MISVRNHDLIALRVLQTPDALNGDVEDPRKIQVSVRMATRAEEVPAEPLGYEVVAEGGWNAVLDVIKDRFGRDTQKKRRGGSARFSVRILTINPFALKVRALWN